MSDSDNNYGSDDDSWCFSIGAASDISEPRLISADDDFLNPSLSTSSGRSSRSSSVGPAESITTDDDTSDTSTPLDETEYEMDDIGNDEVIVLSDDNDIIVLSDGDNNDIIVLSDDDDTVGTVAHSQPPTTSNGPMSTLSASRPKTSKCKEEETAACSQPSPTSNGLMSTLSASRPKTSKRMEEETATCSQPSPRFNRPMSMLSTFSSTTSTCTEDETVTVSSESNGEENFSSSSVKNYLPPCLSSHKLCFDNGIEVDRILGAIIHNRQLLFRVRWRNDKNGGTDYVDAFEMHERCPHMSLQYYDEIYKNKNTDKADK
ncbi:unnamed protein product [Macrosiphum euphorbiae]|uniref:Chromo shadow domain-containing protein n=1 Tax=Macrosiphum euphorbiae TaxID=13131 RepID=A0AAV0WPL4_9HEMI|nr:unnamed protein product [Macrosiphum euphorbiae]